MWKYKKFNKVARIIISVIFALGVIGTEFGEDNTKDSADSTTTEAATEVTTTEATTAKKKKLKKKDYNPQITYNNLARSSDKYEYKRITFQGRVI